MQKVMFLPLAGLLYPPDALQKRPVDFLCRSIKIDKSKEKVPAKPVWYLNEDFFHSSQAARVSQHSWTIGETDNCWKESS